MRAVGIKILKNKLSEYVRMAEKGERILVTDRDRVVAEITAPQPGSATNVSDAVLANLIQNGVVSLARNPQAPLLEPHKTSGISLVDDLLADRNSR